MEARLDTVLFRSGISRTGTDHSGLPIASITGDFGTVMTIVSQTHKFVVGVDTHAKTLFTPLTMPRPANTKTPRTFPLKHG